jgi:hypothetical protein
MTVSVRKMLIAQAGSSPPVSGSSAKQRVEVHRRFGNADALAWSRWCCADRSASRVIEPGNLGHEAFDQLSTRSLRSMKPRPALHASTPVVRAALVEPVSARAASSAGGIQSRVRK